MENSLSLSVNVPENLITTIELANVLHVSLTTVKTTVKKLGRVLGSVLKNNQGGYLFTEKQVTLIKQEIQKHHNLANRQIDNVSTELEENQTIANAMAILQRRAIELQQQLESKNKQIEELTPDAESWRAFAESDGTFSVTNVAKCLGIKRDDIFEFLKLRGYIMREHTQNPNRKGKYQGTALGIERGYIKNYVFTNDKTSNIQFHLTPKGMQKVEKAFLIDKPAQAEKERIDAICKEYEKNIKSRSIGLAE
jgi:phage antirepressor YoqD-like protein